MASETTGTFLFLTPDIQATNDPHLKIVVDERTEMGRVIRVTHINDNLGDQKNFDQTCQRKSLQGRC